MADKTPMKKT